MRKQPSVLKRVLELAAQEGICPSVPTEQEVAAAMEARKYIRQWSEETLRRNPRLREKEFTKLLAEEVHRNEKMRNAVAKSAVYDAFMAVKGH